MKAIPGFIRMSHNLIDHTHARNLKQFYFGEDSLVRFGFLAIPIFLLIFFHFLVSQLGILFG